MNDNNVTFTDLVLTKDEKLNEFIEFYNKFEKELTFINGVELFQDFVNSLIKKIKIAEEAINKCSRMNFDVDTENEKNRMFIAGIEMVLNELKLLLSDYNVYETSKCSSCNESKDILNDFMKSVDKFEDNESETEEFLEDVSEESQTKFYEDITSDLTSVL